MHPAGSDVYPIHRRLESEFRTVVNGTVRKEWNQVTLANDILEAFGEIEHDPSLVWPHKYDDLSDLTDIEVEEKMNAVSSHLEMAADVLREVFAYVVMKEVNGGNSS